MRTGAGDNTYEWIEDWARYPDTDSARAGWAHPGVIVTEAGEVYTTHPGEPAMLVYDRDGHLVRSWKVDAAEIHHILLVKEDDTEFLWLTDNGSKRMPGLGYEYPPESPTTSGQALKTTLDGRVADRLTLPDLPVYRGSRCAITAMAVNDGNGDLWVADGYGQHLIHRYNRHGVYMSSLSGEEGAGRFNCPHGVFIDRRKTEPELYITDRANGRVQVYDMEGQHRRVFGEGTLRLPSAMVTDGDRLIVGDLNARLSVFDREDRFLCHLGDNVDVCSVAGWPNNKDAEGRVIRTRLLEPGKFNSPHGLGVDDQGNLYVAEWLIGGRLIKLAKA